MKHVLSNGYVVSCHDFVFSHSSNGGRGGGGGGHRRGGGGCSRPNCKYFHPPTHLRLLVINAGKNNKRLRSELMTSMQQQQQQQQQQQAALALWKQQQTASIALQQQQHPPSSLLQAYHQQQQQQQYHQLSAAPYYTSAASGIGTVQRQQMCFFKSSYQNDHFASEQRLPWTLTKWPPLPRPPHCLPPQPQPLLRRSKITQQPRLFNAARRPQMSPSPREQRWTLLALLTRTDGRDLPLLTLKGVRIKGRQRTGTGEERGPWTPPSLPPRSGDPLRRTKLAVTAPTTLGGSTLLLLLQLQLRQSHQQ